MDDSGRRGHISAASPMGLAHPIGPDVDLSLEDVAVMIGRALNCVDARLVDHGYRVAQMFDAMLETEGSCTQRQRRALYLAALLHDIGAYRTEDIDRIVEFETESVWEHSFYGYLFFKELSPLAEYAEVILYHHMPNREFTDQGQRIRFLAQCLCVADRADVLLLGRPGLSIDEVQQALGSLCPDELAPEIVDLFVRSEHRLGTLAALREGVGRENPLAIVSDDFEVKKAMSCLDMIVHVIDFRSRHTVTHTVTTAHVAYELTQRVMDEDEAGRVYFSALLHDLGKIGVPPSILEKPGRLDDAEMTIMRTHVVLTERIIAGCVDDGLVRRAVRHHEKLDGSGYPRGLSASQLTLPERIIAVADIVSALVGTRSYKEAYPKEKVLAILGEQRDRGLIDASVVGEVVCSFDDIMDKVAQVSEPVSAAYERVQEEYAWLLDALAEKRHNRDTER
ncbi:MAG: HD domain-containing protein [Gordonibacter sp.]|uniref:HD-GYP domain-containing protein n=1 Tax=Gordonibacter sp. TaxID=1968902 RepID=UPI002FC81C08